jgi:hypothetical protein
MITKASRMTAIQRKRARSPLPTICVMADGRPSPRTPPIRAQTAVASWKPRSDPRSWEGWLRIWPRPRRRLCCKRNERGTAQGSASSVQCAPACAIPSPPTILEWSLTIHT